MSSSSAYESYEPAVKKRRTSRRTATTIPSQQPSASYDSSSPSATPALYTDVVHSIIRFLDFKDIKLVCQLNHLWKESVRSVKPRISGSAFVAKVHPIRATSVLLPHTAHVNIHGYREYDPTKQCELLSIFPSLQGLRMHISTQFNSSNFSVAKLPSSLTSLHVEIQGDTLLQQAIIATSRLAQLKILSYRYTGSWQSEIDFTYLLLLKQLEELEFYASVEDGSDEDTSYPDPISQSFLEAISECVSLRKLSMDYLDDSILILLSEGQMENLQEIVVEVEECSWDEGHLNCLTYFPAWTKFIPPSGCGFVDAGWLLDMDGLIELELPLSLDEPDYVPDADHLVDCMRNLPRLQRLKLIHPEFTGDHLAKLLPQLPSLEHLHLESCYALDHLDAFGTEPTTNKLISLKISKCHLRGDELTKLRALRKLQALSICTQFQLCQMAKSLFQPGSSFPLIPTLVKFTYADDSEDDDE